MAVVDAHLKIFMLRGCDWPRTTTTNKHLLLVLLSGLPQLSLAAYLPINAALLLLYRLVQPRRTVATAAVLLGFFACALCLLTSNYVLGGAIVLCRALHYNPNSDSLVVTVQGLVWNDSIRLGSLRGGLLPPKADCLPPATLLNSLNLANLINNNPTFTYLFCRYDPQLVFDGVGADHLFRALGLYFNRADLFVVKNAPYCDCQLLDGLDMLPWYGDRMDLVEVTALAYSTELTGTLTLAL